MIGRKKLKEPIKIPATVKVPRSLLHPCKGCFWRLGESCTLKLDPIDSECGNYMEERK